MSPAEVGGRQKGVDTNLEPSEESVCVDVILGAAAVHHGGCGRRGLGLIS